MSNSQPNANPANQTTQVNQQPNSIQEPKSWVDVYMKFMEILDRVLETTPDHDEAHELIQGEVDQLYAQHEGTPIWDIAYMRWYEPSDEDPYVEEE